jgi:hypothetical protein
MKFHWTDKFPQKKNDDDPQVYNELKEHEKLDQVQYACHQIYVQNRN